MVAMNEEQESGIITLVVPARNEASLLPRLLDTVEDARRRYSRGREAIEVVVADNASTDGTDAIARDRGCRVVRVEERCIAGRSRQLVRRAG